MPPRDVWLLVSGASACSWVLLVQGPEPVPQSIEVVGIIASEGWEWEWKRRLAAERISERGETPHGELQAYLRARSIT